MRRNDYLDYTFFEQLEPKTELSIFFNKVFKQLQLARTFFAPRTFKDNDKTEKETKQEYESRKTDSALRFYQTCLFELYAFSVIRELERWQQIILEYLNEYDGSWEYYARTNRLKSISEYGGEDNDYNEDDSIKTDVPIDHLLSYSVLGDLVQDDWRDIVLDTEPEDLNAIYSYIRINGSFSIGEMFKAIGCDSIKSYRCANGIMIENSETDEMLNKVKSQSTSDDYSSRLYSIVFIISNIVKEIKGLSKTEDNREYLESLSIRLAKIFDMDILDELTRLRQILK